MRLLPDWKTILKKSSTLRLLEIAALLTFLENFIPTLPEWMPIPSHLLSLLTSATIAAAYFARLIAQKSISGDRNAD